MKNIFKLKQTMKKILVLITALALFTSCKKTVSSNDINQNVPVYQDYEVVYDKITNKTIAKATFRVRDENGVQIKLDEGSSKILANGVKYRDYSASGLKAYQYYWEFDNFTDVKFSYEKEKGKVYDKGIQAAQKLDIDFPQNFSLSKKGTSFNWVGSPDSPTGSKVEIIATGSAGFKSSVVSGATINLTPDYLKDFKTGEIVKITLKRTLLVKIPKGSDGDAGGQIAVVVTIDKTVELND